VGRRVLIVGSGGPEHALALRLAADEGCHTFDLLRGDEPYKYRFGAVDRPLHTLTLLRGRA
jgi:CelD/BcsL family acetyltransferase involved in cellulose biosynthesis